jgi:lysozyme
MLMATSSELRHAGIHWPENAGGEHPNAEKIALMPGMRGAFLICSPSARWYWEMVTHVNHDAAKVWRGIPEQGSLPAQLGWNAGKVADACLLHYDEQVHVNGEWFLPLNELQFEKEAGAPFLGYGVMAGHLGALRQVLRARLPKTTGLMFPAWVPSDDMDHLDEWRAEAALWDAICLHTYGDFQSMWNRYKSYRDAFPDVPLFVGEWNANHTGADERASLAMWSWVATADPYFLGATYYIWETNNEGEHDLSIWGNPDRLALFSDPPLAAVDLPPVIEPEPQPPVEPEPPMPLSEKPQGVDVASYQGYPDWAAVKAAGFVFGITKFTEGLDYINPTAGYNWTGMDRVGMKRVAYHWGRPSQDARQQVEFFWNAVGEAGGWHPGDCLDLDIEESGGDEPAWAEQFMDALDDRIPQDACLLYSGAWFTNPKGFANHPGLARYKLWLADYGRSTVPPAPAPWDRVTIWQYSSTGRVPGIDGDVDLNEFQGTYEELAALGQGGGQPPVSEFSVGPGILAKMQEQGTSPATDEIDRGDYAEAFDTSGNHYVYIKSLNQTFVTWKTA